MAAVGIGLAVRHIAPAAAGNTDQSSYDQARLVESAFGSLEVGFGRHIGAAAGSLVRMENCQQISHERCRVLRIYSPDFCS